LKPPRGVRQKQVTTAGRLLKATRKAGRECEEEVKIQERKSAVEVVIPALLSTCGEYNDSLESYF